MKKVFVRNEIRAAVRAVEPHLRIAVLIDMLTEHYTMPDHVESPDYFWDLMETD